MTLILVLLPLALLLTAVAVVAFVWAARKGQFDDLKTPAVRILFEDPPAPGKTIDDASPPAGDAGPGKAADDPEGAR